MKVENFDKFDLLDTKSSNEVQRMISGLVQANGVAITYYPWDEDTNTFLDGVEMKCYMEQADDEAGEAVVSNYYKLIIPTKVFVDNEISPSDQDNIVFNGDRYLVTFPIIYYDKNNMASDIFDASYLISMNIAQKGQFSRK